MVKLRTSLVYTVSIILLLGGVFLLSPNISDGTDAKALFEAKCNLCHSIERPNSKKKSHDAWKSTVMRMKNINGCPITDDEAEIVIKYLAENYGDK